MRQLCKLLGDSISRNIERLSYAKRLHSRKLINTAPTSSNPSGYIVAKAEDLLTLFDADFGVLSIGEEAKVRWWCTVDWRRRPKIGRAHV